MATTAQYPQIGDVKSRNPGTTQGQQQHDGDGSTPMERQRLRPPSATGPMPLRYFSVGRSTERVICPLCREECSKIDDGTKGNFCDTLNGWLCCLSCCFPIFALSCCYICIRGFSLTPRKFCSKCGGYLGFQSRPK